MMRPWFKFFPGDWQRDPRLGLCSATARGVWIEMLALMHSAPRRGCFEVQERRKPGDEEGARLCRYSIVDFQAGLKELLEHGVASVEQGTGIVFSRRMVSDTIRSARGHYHGRHGGNPSLVSDKPKEREEDAKDQQQASILLPEVRGQRSEVRSQRKGEGAPISGGVMGCTPESTTDVIEYGHTIGLGEDDCWSFVDHFQSNGWKVGGKAPMRDWKAALRNWKRNQDKWANAGGRSRRVATRREGGSSTRVEL